uniref:Uncharacterized protein n=1 Tax=Octopus bimaculoides TaxID=37653 RepID=A0A0L8G109_OCTBM
MMLVAEFESYPRHHSKSKLLKQILSISRGSLLLKYTSMIEILQPNYA